MQIAKLQELKEKLMHSATLVQQMLSLAAIDSPQKDSFAKVQQLEEMVNALENEIDELATRLIALYQPEASDLRRILMMYRINVDLERLADQAYNIAESACRIQDYRITESKIFQMQEATSQMLKAALQAFMDEDVEACEAVYMNDNLVDEMNKDIYHLVVDHIQRQPQDAHSYLHLLRIAKNLERCADLATNIAENTIYLVRGKVIRHQGLDT